jgi:hypothetical protein
MLRRDGDKVMGDIIELRKEIDYQQARNNDLAV